MQAPGDDASRESEGKAVVWRLGAALREALAQGYGARDLRGDLVAGCVVGVVALPLSMALAIATGVPPEHGLYTAIVAGATAALLGGSRVQVTGPTAAFVVVMAPVTARFGLRGLCVASLMAGLLLIGMGCLRLGRLIRFMPYPVTTGFTAGIGLVIATLQIQAFLGLDVPGLGADATWAHRVAALARALPTCRAADLVVGASTLFVLLAWRRVRSAVPSPLVALVTGVLVAWLLERTAGWSVDTLQTRFGSPTAPWGIPRTAPLPVLPWELAGPAGGAAIGISLDLVRSLLPSAFAIAMLGAIESLLSAVIADGMAGTKHDSDVELLALGISNVVAPFFGGFAATGAIARTATNVRSGARSPVAALVHTVFVLASVLALAPALGRIPMASLAALLLMVAWNMSEVRHFVHTLRTAPRGDAAVLLSCFALTVVFDMTLAVTAGVLLAALLFMHRMIELSGAKLIGEHHPEHGVPLPPGVLVYEIQGPLFFGAAHKATSQLFSFNRKGVRAVLLDLEDVPTIDATGIVNLRSALERLARAGIEVRLFGLRPGPLEALRRSGAVRPEGPVEHHADLRQALASLRSDS